MTELQTGSELEHDRASTERGEVKHQQSFVIWRHFNRSVLWFKLLLPPLLLSHQPGFLNCILEAASKTGGSF